MKIKKIETDYSNLENFKYYCKNSNINIIKIEYFENIVIKIEIEKSKKDVFFKDIEGFTSKDIDILEFVDNPTDFKNVRQFKFPHKCVFQWRKMPVNELIDITLFRDFPMEIGKFLVPEFIKEFKLSIDDLKRLKPIISKLDDKHKY